MLGTFPQFGCPRTCSLEEAYMVKTYIALNNKNGRVEVEAETMSGSASGVELKIGRPSRTGKNLMVTVAYFPAADLVGVWEKDIEKTKTGF